jgi:hypothetical protein
VDTFTVNDPGTSTQPWTAEILFRRPTRIVQFAVTKPITSDDVLSRRAVTDQSPRNYGLD